MSISEAEVKGRSPSTPAAQPPAEEGPSATLESYTTVTGPTVHTTLEAMNQPARNWREVEVEGVGALEYRREGRRKGDGASVFISAEVEHDAEHQRMKQARKIVDSLNPETSDIFIAICTKLAELHDPQTGSVTIEAQELAGFRGVATRRGSRETLYRDLLEQVRKLARLRMSLAWTLNGHRVEAGRDLPMPILHIVDLHARGESGFRVRAGEPLTVTMQRDGIRTVGRYSQALLCLNPRQDQIAKALGKYLMLLRASDRDAAPRFTMRMALRFCGYQQPERDIGPKKGRLVDQCIDAFGKLHEIGLLADVPDVDPPERRRGYFERWLNEPRTANLVEARDAAGRAKPISRPRHRSRRTGARQAQLPFPLLEGFDGATLRAFRKGRGLRQQDLAELLDVQRETLSRYERGVRPIPQDLRERLLSLGGALRAVTFARTPGGTKLHPGWNQTTPRVEPNALSTLANH